MNMDELLHVNETVSTYKHAKGRVESAINSIASVDPNNEQPILATINNRSFIVSPELAIDLFNLILCDADKRLAVVTNELKTLGLEV